MNASTPQALRIALIHNSRIIEDRTLPVGRRVKVSVGSDAHSTFCVPMADLPASTTLFQVSGAQAVMVRSPFNATPRPLERDAKGRVSIGDVTVLYQMVTPARAAPVPELPRGARGLVGQLDRVFLVTMVASFAAHLAGAGYVMSQPAPVDPELSLAELAHGRFAAQLLPIPAQLRAPPKPAVPEAVKPSAPEAPIAAKRPSSKSAEAPGARPSALVPSPEALKRRLAGMGMLAVIGSAGDGTGGVGDLLKEASGIEDAVRGTGGVRVGTAADALVATRRGAQAGDAVTVGPLGSDGVKQVVLAEKAIASVKGTLRQEALTVETADISPDALGAWMRGRKAAIQACYERELKRHQTLAGRLVLRFSVTPRGRVADVQFTENTLGSPEVSQCIEQVMKGWVLPFTPEDDVPVSFPFVFSPAS